MNKNSNQYTFLFSTVMVVVVAFILAFAALQLKAPQQKNIKIEKMQNILTSINVNASFEDAEAKYKKYIVGEVVINNKAEVVEGVKAFDVDLAVESKKNPSERLYPMFICKLDDGNQYYVIPLRGKGLWGPIWGYVSLQSDYNTIYGASFDHKGETPGLGAEISKKDFQKQFIGKQLFDKDGNFKSVSVAKKGAFATSYPHAVDGISGGTITSNGVQNMLYEFFNIFQVYFKKNKAIQ